MDTLRIFVETSTMGPMRVKAGVSKWRRERIVNGVCVMNPDSDQGYIHGHDITETELTLKALINALWKIDGSYHLEIHNSCQTVHNALQYKWYVQWQQDGWNNAYGKPIKYPQLWEMLVKKLAPHTLEVKGGKHEYRQIMEYEIENEMKRWKESTPSLEK